MSGKTITIPYDEYLQLQYYKKWLQFINKAKEFKSQKSNEAIEKIDFDICFGQGISYVQLTRHFDLLKVCVEDILNTYSKDSTVKLRQAYNDVLICNVLLRTEKEIKKTQ